MNIIIYIILILAVFMAQPGYAQVNIFGFTQVDFFISEEHFDLIQEVGQEKQTVLRQDDEANEIENLWTEPLIQPDGSTVNYTPPKIVTDFLDNPNEKTGQAYLNWNNERILKLSKAQIVLRSLSSNLISSYYSNLSPRPDNLSIKTDIKYMGFFLLKGCPYCETQKGIISNLIKNRPDIKIDVFVKGYTSQDIKILPFPAKVDNGYSRSLGFNKFPTTLIINQNGQQSLVAGVLSNQLISSLNKGGKS